MGRPKQAGSLAGAMVVGSIGFGALLLLGSCAAPAAAPPPAAIPAPVPTPTPTPTPTGPVDLTFAGPLTQGGLLRGTVPGGTTELRFDGEAVPFAEDGAFVIAFDRDAGTTASLVAKLGDGRSIGKDIAVSPRDWNIERVNVGQRAGASSEEFERRRAGELAQINAARSIRSDSTGWRQDFIWPAYGRLSGMFGSQRIYRGVPGSYHSGTDIAGPTGAPFVAPADGVVVLAADSPFTLEGNLLIVDHGMGLTSAFLHCSEILVKVGDQVSQGQAIGRIGATGRATGPHLHWAIKWNAARIDPILLTGPMPK